MCVFAHAIEQQQPRAHRLTRLASNFMWIELDFLIRIWCYDVVGRWRGRPPPLLWQQHQIERKKEAKWMSIFDLNFTITHSAQFRSSWTGRDAGYRAHSSHHLLTAEMDCSTEITQRKSRTISCVVSATTTQKYSLLCYEFLQSKLCACLCAVSKLNPLFDREK